MWRCVWHTGYKSSLDPKEIKNKEKGGPNSLKSVEFAWIWQ